MEGRGKQTIIGKVSDMKSLIGLGIGAVIGGIVGYSQILCMAGGACPLTSSWYGTAIFGGILGFLIAGGCPACSSSQCETENQPERQQPENDSSSGP
jgi:hypothetical protein